jgi:5'-nucleotidase
MKILLSNDDGIYARGISVLHDCIQDLGEVHVVAPDTERSAVGHGITLTDPLKTRKYHRNDTFFGYSVSGTPADCVKLATCALLDPVPDVVASGINLGPNAGVSVIYSGTVSAATEGSILGFPSIAFSLATYTDPQWQTAAICARGVMERFIATHPPPDCLVNVNIPNVPPGEIQGYRVTRTARSRFKEIFHKRSDPRGNTYYWLDGDLEELNDARFADHDTDLKALAENYVAITPIIIDRTGFDHMQFLRETFSDC